MWQKQAGENYEIGDEPGRIVAIADGKVVVDWGMDDVPTEEKPEDLLIATPIDGEGTIFEQPLSQEEAEVQAGLNAFTPASHEVQKVLSNLSFADVMAEHAKSIPEDEDTVTHVATSIKGTVVSKASNGQLNVRFGESVIKLWPYEVR